MEAGCHERAATCTQGLLKKLRIHALGLWAQPVSLSQKKKKCCFKICKSISCPAQALCTIYGCMLWKEFCVSDLVHFFSGPKTEMHKKAQTAMNECQKLVH